MLASLCGPHLHHGAACVLPCTSMRMRPARLPQPGRMASLAGTTSIAYDSARSWLPNDGLYRRTHVPISSPGVWSPHSGIVFARPGTPQLMGRKSMPRGGYDAATRSMSTATAAALEQQLAAHSHAEDSYVLSGTFTTQDSEKAVQQSHEQIYESDLAGQLEAFNLSADVTTEVRLQHAPCDYSIPDEVLKRSQAADTRQYWSHRLYSNPAGKHPIVHYCTTLSTTEKVLQTHFRNESVLGFDIEWVVNATNVSGIKKNVALIQLASASRIVLIHLGLFPGSTVDDLCSPTLKAIMESPDITKAGVAIKADCTRMRRHLGMECQGIFELSHLYKLVKHAGTNDVHLVNKMLVNLALQVEEHLALPLYKGEEVRGSDWSKPLSMKQIQYAASDSYAGFMLYSVLEAKRLTLDPVPPRPFFAELNRPIRLANGAEISAADLVEEDISPDDERAVRRVAGADIQPRRSSRAYEESSPMAEAIAEAGKWATAYRLSHPTASYERTATAEADTTHSTSDYPVDSPDTHSSTPENQSQATNSPPLDPSISRTPASHAQLRAYHLWHTRLLEIGRLAEILNIKAVTAAQYVVETLAREGLGEATSSDSVSPLDGVSGAKTYLRPGRGEARGLPFCAVRLERVLKRLPPNMGNRWLVRDVQRKLEAVLVRGHSGGGGGGADRDEE